MRLLTFCLCVLVLVSAQAAGPEYGAVQISQVNSVYDGDTFRVTIAGWPSIVGENIPVRVAGIDTPEIRGKCLREKELARKAKAFVRNRLAQAHTIELRNIRRGKYFRLVANVYVDGQDLTQMLISQGLGVPYDGGHKSVNWCIQANPAY